MAHASGSTLELPTAGGNPGKGSLPRAPDCLPLVGVPHTVLPTALPKEFFEIGPALQYAEKSLRRMSPALTVLMVPPWYHVIGNIEDMDG